MAHEEGAGVLHPGCLKDRPPRGIPKDDRESRLPPRLDPVWVDVKGDVARGDQWVLQQVGQDLALGAKPTDHDRINQLLRKWNGPGR